MPIVRMPDNTKVRFPDDMPKEQIRSLIAKKFPDSVPQQQTEDESWIDKAGPWAERFINGREGVLRNTLNSLSLGYLYNVRPDLEEKSWNDIAKSPFPRAMGVAGGVLPVAANMIPTIGAERFLSYLGSKALPYITKAPKLAESAIKTISGMGSTALDAAARSVAQGDTENVGERVGDALKFDLALRTALGGLGKAFSAGNLVKGVKKQGLSNVVDLDDAQKVLDRGTKARTDIAKEVKRQTPEALENINKDSIDLLDNTVGGGVNVEEKMSSAKKAYRDYIDANKANQVIEGKFTPEEYQANLMKWSGGKEPIKVYHGTRSKIESFDPTIAGKNSQAPKGSIFTTTNEDVAKTYAKSIEGLQGQIEMDANSNVIPLYGKMKNPYIIDANKSNWNEIPYKGQLVQTNDIVEDILNQNKSSKNLSKVLPDMFKEYDGVIIKNVYDNAALVNKKLGDNYVFFDPKQLKSVQNSGAFTNTASLTDKGVKPLAKVSDLGINDKLSTTQKEALEKAWNSGVKELKKGEVVGSLKHIDEMKQNLNMQIRDSMKPKVDGIGLEDTKQTVALRELKGYLQDTMNKAGLSGINKEYREAKRLKELYNSGKNFNPNKQNVSDFKLSTPDEKSAFAQGLVEKAKMNPESKNVSKNALSLTGALKKVMPEEQTTKTLEELRKNEERYGRVAQLQRTAERKTGTADPLPRPKSEVVESAGAVSGHLADIILNNVLANKYGRASQMLLGVKPLAKPLYDRFEQFVPAIASYLPDKRNKKGE